MYSGLAAFGTILNPGLIAQGMFLYLGLAALCTSRDLRATSQDLQPLVHFFYPGLAALGRYLYLGLADLGTYLYLGLVALGTFSYQVIFINPYGHHQFVLVFSGDWIELFLEPAG